MGNGNDRGIIGYFHSTLVSTTYRVVFTPCWHLLHTSRLTTCRHRCNWTLCATPTIVQLRKHQHLIKPKCSPNYTLMRQQLCAAIVPTKKRLSNKSGQCRRYQLIQHFKDFDPTTLAIILILFMSNQKFMCWPLARRGSWVPNYDQCEIHEHVQSSLRPLQDQASRASRRTGPYWSKESEGYPIRACHYP